MKRARGANYIKSIRGTVHVTREGSGHPVRPSTSLCCRFDLHYLPHGEPCIVHAEGGAALVGGDAYPTVANGWSDPVEVPPGSRARVTRTWIGNPISFARYRVEEVH